MALYGTRMLMPSLEYMLKSDLIKQEDIRNKLHQLYNEGCVKSTEFYETSFYCNKCKALSSELYIKLELNDGDKYIPQYACEACGGDLKRIKKDKIISDARCPHCGGTFSNDVGYGDWD